MSSSSKVWLKVVLLALSLCQLGLGAAQECEGVVQALGVTPDQVKEIRASVAIALKQGTILNFSRNETCVTWEEFNSTLEKIVDVAIENILLLHAGIANASGGVNVIEAHIMTAVNKIITNISNSFEQLVSPIMTQLHFLRLPGSTPSHPASSC